MQMSNFIRSVLAAIALTMATTAPGWAACILRHMPTAPEPQDPVAQVLKLQSTCPMTAPEFIEALNRLNVRTEPTTVNFHGFHNRDPGEFFFFEVASGGSPTLKIERGDLLFGHFTGVAGRRLVSNTENLIIELIAWDPNKGFFNFYELTDDREEGVRGWFYRGDSEDILKDVEPLHRGSADPFRSPPKLRCSGCHINGGLLQKELAAPHNDWFVRDRPLTSNFGKDEFIDGRFKATVDAGELSKLVVESTRRLAASPGYRRVLAGRSMQERLRTLFCPMEVNIESDLDAFDDRKPTLQVPSAFFVDPRLAKGTISIKREHYDAALEKMHSLLPRSSPRRNDADHGWLTPVKAQTDIVAVEALIEQGVIDNNFVAAVLAVDFANPVFSKTRCGLLKLVPESGGTDFVARFQSALRGSSAPEVGTLLSNLANPASNQRIPRKNTPRKKDRPPARCGDLKSAVFSVTISPNFVGIFCTASTCATRRRPGNG